MCFCLRRDELEAVMKALHFCDNAQLNEDGFYKVFICFVFF